MCVQNVWEGSLDDHVTSNTWASIWKNKTKTSNSVSSNNFPVLNKLQDASGWLWLCVILFSVPVMSILVGSVLFFCLKHIIVSCRVNTCLPEEFNTVFSFLKHIYFLIGATKTITLIDIHLLTQCIDAHLENTLQQLLFLLTFSHRN